MYNNSAAAIDISGWLIKGSNTSGTVSTRVTVVANTLLKPGCYFLATNSTSPGYSGPVPGDQTYGTGITDDGGIALFSPPVRDSATSAIATLPPCIP